MGGKLFVILAVAALGSQALASQTPAPAGPAPAQEAPKPAPPPAPAQAPTPGAPAPPQRPAFRAGVDIVSLNVTVQDAGGHYVTDLDQQEFSIFEDGVKQEISFFNRRQQPIALSLLLDSSASMEDKLEELQVAAKSFVKRLKPNDIAQVIDFDSRVEIRQGFTGNQPELEAAIGKTSAGGSTSLHNAIYIALKELKKVKAVSEEDVRRQALVVFSDGEDTSSLISFDEVLDLAKRSETAIYTIALRGVDTQTKGFREAEFVMRQLAQETGGRAFFPAKIEELTSVYAQIADELASQYTIGYTSKNGRRDGAFRRVVVQTTRPGLTPRTKKGYFAPTAQVKILPLLLYAVSAVAYAIHFARRDPAAGRAATASLLVAALAHTFVIGMQTMEVRHIPFASLPNVISTFVWLLTLSYLYLEISTEERAMGVFILPIAIGLQSISALTPGVEKVDPVLDSPWFWIHVASLLCAYASFALAAVLGLIYMLQFKEIKKKHLGYLYNRLPSLLTLDVMNSRAMTIGWVFLTVGVAVGVTWTAQARPLSPDDPNLRAMSLDDPKIFFAVLTWAVYSFALFARTRLGWTGRRAAWLATVGFLIVLLNLLPIGYFVTTSHTFQ